MRKIEGKGMLLRFPDELHTRIKVQAEKEGRSIADFVRRVLDRYLLEHEFRGDISSDVRRSIEKNKELLKLLKDS
jgi:predicted DNA-binding protein